MFGTGTGLRFGPFHNETSQVQLQHQDLDRHGTRDSQLSGQSLRRRFPRIQREAGSKSPVIINWVIGGGGVVEEFENEGQAVVGKAKSVVVGKAGEFGQLNKPKS